ncbi:MAG: OmpA family protein [Acidobacteria bacterium]|nr:OmpA family protein [Acidobacteriota bacterium]
MLRCHKQPARAGLGPEEGVAQGVPVEVPELSQLKTIDDSGVTEPELEKIISQLQPIFFDFDKSGIRQDQVGSLVANSGVLKENSVPVVIEGHCDERGTEEYNLALGQRRANAARSYLVTLGVRPDVLTTISYGKSRPFSLGHNEDAWSQNRRAHFVALPPQAALKATQR